MSMKSNIRELDLQIKSNVKISKNTYELVLVGTDFSDCKPGQFVNLLINDFYLRRPISVSSYTKDELTLIYKVLGEGTKKLSTYVKGQEISTLLFLGNGYELPPKNITEVTIIGAGIGLAPQKALYDFLKQNSEVNIKVLIAFRNSEDQFLEDSFENQIVCLDENNDNILNHINDNDYVYACGPNGLLDKIALTNKGQYLLEERMGCGFGACMGCSKRISKNEYKRVCVEGPMFYQEEVIYELKN